MSGNNSKAPKNPPVHEVRIGTIKAVVWANKVPNGTMHNVVPVRIYKDDAGVWHDSNSFGRADLLDLAKALDMAHSWILEAEQK